MSDTLPNVKLPKGGGWIDIYDALGIVVGTAITIQSLLTASIQFTIKATEPDSSDGYKLLTKGEQLVIPVGSSGLWMSSLPGGAVNVDTSASTIPIGVYDGFGNPIGSYMGAIDVHQAEVHSEVVNELFNLHTGLTTTIAVAVNAGDTSVEVVDTTGFIVGSVLEIHDGSTETTFPVITSLPGANVMVLDRPLDFNYAIGDNVDEVHTDLKTSVGTLAAPIVHVIKPGPGQIWYINRIILTMVHGSAGADDKFGDLAALINGVVLRANINGQYGSFTNWKNNGDIRRDMFDVTYSDKAGGPAGFGTSGRGSFNRIGVVIRLDGDVGDFMDVLVQDNLQALDSLFINGQGYIERT